MLPAEVAQPMAGNLIVATNSIGRDRGTKRRGQTANCADECKKQKVLHWQKAVQKHRCPNSLCEKCGRRGNWCIVGSASKNVFTNVSLYKKNLSISESGVAALEEFIQPPKQSLADTTSSRIQTSANLLPNLVVSPRTPAQCISLQSDAQLA